MRRGRVIRWAFGLLAGIHVAILFADFLAPYHFAAQHRNYPYAPPSTLHFRDAAGRFHLRPFVYALVPEQGSTVYREDTTQVYRLQFLVATPGEHWTGILPFRVRLFGVEPPGVFFPLGTDGYGRDVFSRLMYGAQVSLFAGLLAAAVSLGIGLCGGMAAGYLGGWVDQLLMRAGELFMALPWLYLLLAVRAFLPLHIGPVQAFALLVAIIGCVGWVRPARLIRGVVLSARERGFVQAARGFGAGGGYIVRRHILPLTYGVVVTQATVLIPRYVLAEVTLSFLGLGVAEPVPSWGNMLGEARQYHALMSHGWMLAPAAAMVLILLLYLVLADSLLAGEEA